MNGMTERQEEILEFIRQHQQEHQLPPSTRDIQRHFGFSSQTTVMGHLQALAAKQHLTKLADRKWGLKATAVQGQLFALPVYGAIPAGLPAMQEQAAEETLQIDPAVFGLRRPKPHQYWALRVTGDSMIDAHILDGDLVVLERREPKTGDVIAALVDETSTTLKRLVKANGRLVLRAENKRYNDIAPERIESQGVLVGVIRRHPART
ncbi:MAG TPA: transcriptional repressor LexA [Lacunisphaera sp.]|nr:transcriptional repressor LexA [Lacunisphaera sp.]